jgi:transposase
MARMSRQAQVAVALWRARARHWQGEAARLGGENTRLGARVAELEAKVDGLGEQVAALARVAFGSSSEKTPVVVAAGGAGGRGGAAGGAGGGRGRGQQRGAPGHGRRDDSGLPTVEVVAAPEVAERVCPRCGREDAPNGEEQTELIDWQVRLCRVVVRRPRYRRRCQCLVKRELVAPPPPRPISKGRYRVGFVVRLLVDKYVLGRPLHRIAMALSYTGLQVAQGTLVGVLAQVSGLLAPLEQQLWARNRTAGHLHVDETGWKVFAPLAGKASKRWWCWVVVGPDTTVFRIERSRSTRVLAEHLGIDLDADGLQPGRQLLVSSDFYGVYQLLGQLEGVEQGSGVFRDCPGLS